MIAAVLTADDHIAKAVRPGPDDDRVIARAARNRVSPRAAIKQVIARVAGNQVIAGTAKDGVGIIAAIK